MSNRFDAIVVGARCAGSPTAMLLARAGCRVLLVDRHSFPSDTLSTHLLHPLGVAALRSWLDGVWEHALADFHKFAEQTVADQEAGTDPTDQSRKEQP